MKYSSPIKTFMILSYAFAVLVMLAPLLSLRHLWPFWPNFALAWAFLLLGGAIGFIYSELSEISKKLDESPHSEGNNSDLSK